MSTALLREHDNIFADLPSGVFLRRSVVAEQPAPRVWPEIAGSERPTYIHPTAIGLAASGFATMMLAFWVCFFGRGEMTPTLGISTLISMIMLGLMAGAGGGRSVTPWQRQWRSFSESLDGEIEVWGTCVHGREAVVQIAGLAWGLAALAEAFCIIIACVRP